jgi:FkbM family methyltransferase
MKPQNPSLLPDFVHARNVEPAQGNLKLVTFPDGFRCYTHTSIEETEFIYNEVYVKQEYLCHGLTLEDLSCVFDIGANIGIFTLFVKSKNPRAVIHAFEPIQETCEVLRLNIKLHQLTRVFTHNVALGARAATQRTFTYYPNMAGSSTATPIIKKTQRKLMEDGAGKTLTDFFFESETRVAPVQTLSAFIEEQGIPEIGFLKIDIEGDELAVLQGIDRKHISRIRQLVIEAHTSEIGREIYARLTRMGFKVVSDTGLASPAEVSDIYAINTGRQEDH